jgi:hypothetical protein
MSATPRSSGRDFTIRQHIQAPPLQTAQSGFLCGIYERMPINRAKW